nr:uncharacterized protein LOC109157601 [Ipomoea batatas]
MVQFQDQWFERQRKLVISSTKSDHKVTLSVNQPLASPSPPKLTVSYHERNWTPRYDIPPSKVWTLQPGLKHEPSTNILPTLGSRIIDDDVKWGIWNDICEKLKETPAESVSSFKGSVERQIQLMKHNAVDLSSLENRVDVFFKKAEDYDKIRSKHLEAMPVETQVAELCLAQNALKDAQQKLSETQTLLSEKQKILEDSDGQVTLLEEAIKEVEKTIKEAEKTIKDSREELTRIHDERPKLQELVTKAQEQRNASQEAVNFAEETVKRIQETPMLTYEDEGKLSLVEKDLEAEKADLMIFFRIL